jgi:hypothetical protein
MIEHITYSEKLIVGALKRAEEMEISNPEASNAAV